MIYQHRNRYYILDDTIIGISAIFTMYYDIFFIMKDTVLVIPGDGTDLKKIRENTALV